jgi:hypothetical protein
VLWLTRQADLVLVFFDPHGQATCARTNTIVQQINREPALRQKVRYFLTRADEIRTETERSKVLTQLSQSLGRSIAPDAKSGPGFYGQHALEVMTIYRPQPGARRVQDFNQINQLVELIDRTVHDMVQKHCEQLESDAKELDSAVQRELQRDAESLRHNHRMVSVNQFAVAAMWTLPLLLLFYALRVAESLFLPSSWKTQPSWALHVALRVIRVGASVASAFDSGTYRFHFVLFVLAAFLGAMALAFFADKLRVRVRPRAAVKKLREWQDVLRHELRGDHGLVQRVWKEVLGRSTVDSIKDSAQRTAAAAAAAAAAAKVTAATAATAAAPTAAASLSPAPGPQTPSASSLQSLAPAAK